MGFWYRTANSCTPDDEAYRCYFQAMQASGWNVDDFLGTGYYPQWKADPWGGNKCEPGVNARANNCGEQFKNCADVKVIGGTGGGSTPSTPSLVQGHFAKVHPHRSLRSRGSSMLAEGVEMDEMDMHDEPLVETDGSQDEL